MVRVMATQLLLGSVVLVGSGPQAVTPERPQGTPAVPQAEASPTAPHKPDLHPRAPEPVPDGEIVAALQRGVDFLLKDQNSDGSWGSPHRTKELNILAGIGSHHAFRTAVTSLCVCALIEVSGSRESKLRDLTKVQRAIERGEEFLLSELARVRRDEPMLIYYYGHYYATLCVDQLPPQARPFYQDHLARILLSHQERDGSWWDYPLYNYHQQYGTAFALLSLEHSRKW